MHASTCSFVFILSLSAAMPAAASDLARDAEMPPSAPVAAASMTAMLPATDLPPVTTPSSGTSAGQITAAIDRHASALAAPVPLVGSVGDGKAVRAGMYGLFAGLQALDAITTSAMLKAGGVEANLLMRPIALRPSLFFSVKAAVTVWTLWRAERFARRRDSRSALLFMTASNGLYGFIVGRNVQQLGLMR